MKKCTKCHGETIGVKFIHVGTESHWFNLIDEVDQYLDNPSKKYARVTKEHLVYTCQCCGYKIAKDCKDKL